MDTILACRATAELAREWLAQYQAATPAVRAEMVASERKADDAWRYGQQDRPWPVAA